VRGALVAAAVNAAPALCAWSSGLRRRLGVEYELADRSAVALTFDDGPHPNGTPAILEALAEHGVTATFFLVGEQVERRPQLAARIVAEGHEVGLHCHRHRNLLRLPPHQVWRDMERARGAIEQAAGVPLRLYRPPYGVLTTSALAAARRLGLRPVLWSRWGRDWRAAATPATISAELCGDLTGGEVLLLHDSDAYSALDSWKRTAAALPRVLSTLEWAGLRPARIA
jgi:peptidoglycan-N-acetylglucosamine deacetylase